MLIFEDRLLVWRFNRGDPVALCQIYEKHRLSLLKTAAALLNDKSGVEDVLHDVFVNFSRLTGRFQLKGSLKGYLSICVANRARDRNRMMQRQASSSIDDTLLHPTGVDCPERNAMSRELTAKLNTAMAQLPVEQRETIVMHLHQKLPFREIALLQEISTNTVMSRYRYGVEKLRSLLDGEFGV